MNETLLGQAIPVLRNEVEVAAVQVLSPRVRRIDLRGDFIERMRWYPGDKIKINVGGGTMRLYTPSRVDPAARRMEVVAHVHGHGPGSRWVERVRAGDAVSFIGPAHSMPIEFGPPPPWALFFGDETALGLGQALIEGADPETHIFGAVELAREDLKAAAAMGLPLDAIARGRVHGEALVDWLDYQSFPPGDGIVWLSGEANSVLELRHALMSRGIAPGALRVKPYWSAYRKTGRRLVRSALVA
ncbi:MAG: siderophore-interacting protein [Myxococcota bacterium]